MSYSKPWQKCLNEIEKYTSVPVEDWDHYQLLGYVLSQTSQKFEPVDVLDTNAHFVNKNATSPSRHPMVESIRTIYRQFDKCPVKTKKFLDWCLARYKTKLNIRGLRYLHTYYSTSMKSDSLSIPLRTDQLPKDIKSLFSDLGLKTYGELASLRYDDGLTQILVERLASIGRTMESLHLHKIT